MPLKTRLPRPLYILYRLAEMIIQVLSRLLNALSGGSTYQTFSSRVHVERTLNPASRKWRILRSLVNALFFVQKDHCLEAWEAEVYHAEKTLERATMQWAEVADGQA